MQRSRKQHPKRRGVAAVELAICLPMVVMLVLGSIEACSMIFINQSLCVAGYEGMRIAVRKGGTSAEAIAGCNELLSARGVQAATVSLSPTNVSGLSSGTLMTITVTAPCGDNSILPSRFFRGRTLTATCTMVKE
jgi:Flp pilus assembly protein TadG